MSARRRPALLWQSRSLGRSGYASLAREFLRGLSNRPVDLAFRPFTPEPEKDPDVRDAEWYRRISSAPIVPNSAYLACYTPSSQLGDSYFQEARDMNPGHSRYIGYTMFETDRIPLPWVDAIREMDEIWVPTRFNVETFSRSGVPQSKLRVVAPGIDPSRFDPKDRKPFPLKTGKQFRFFSAFEWSLRKGWDALLRGYCEEFRREDPVSLVICTYRGGGVNNLQHPVDPEQELNRFLLEKLGMPREKAPEILVLEERIPNERWADLFAACDAFVLPTRGEGWGVPFTEAAISGLPVVATAWSAQLDYLNPENSYPIEIEGLKQVPTAQSVDNWHYTGSCWAEPSVPSLRRQLRRVFENRSEAKEKGRLARETMLSSFTLDKAAARVQSRLEEIASENAPGASLALPAAAETKPLRMLWIGEDPNDDGLRWLLACYCATVEDPALAELRIGSVSEKNAKKIAEMVESFQKLAKGPIRFLGTLDAKGRNEALAACDLFVFPTIWRQESPWVREAIQNGVCVLASKESIPPSHRDSRCALQFSMKSVPKGRGAQRRLVGKSRPTVIGILLRWALDHPQELRSMGAAAKAIRFEGRAVSREPLILSEEPLPGISEAEFESRRFAVSLEGGGWSGAVNLQLCREQREFVAIVQGNVVPDRAAFDAMKAEPQAAMLYETTREGAYALVRPQIALAFSELDGRFHGLDALREWARSIRAQEGIVLSGSDHRLGAPFENEKDDGAIAFLELADSLAAQGKKSESLAAARQALTWKVDYVEALLFLSRALSESEDEASLEEAKQLLARALAIKPQDARLRHCLSRVLTRRGEFDQALVQLNIVTKSDPENAEIWNDLGVVQGTLGQLRESLDSLMHSQQIDQANADAWENGAVVLEALGETSQAQAWRQQAIHCEEGA